MTKKRSITQFLVSDPFHMAIGVAVLSIPFQLLFLILKPMAPAMLDQQTPWVIAVAMLLFYIIFNAIATFSTKSIAKNWIRSIYGFGALAFFSFIIAQLLSGLKLKDIPEFKWIIILMILGFFILKAIATLIIEVVLYTKRKDKEQFLREYGHDEEE